jgi:hypothetical protein
VEIQKKYQYTLLDYVGSRVFIDDALKLDYDRHYDVVITNSPFSLAEAYIKKFLPVCNHLVLFLRLDFLAGAKRHALLHKHMPSVYVLPNRPTFIKGGTDQYNYGWFVWSSRPPTLKLLDLTPAEERR